LGDGTKLQLGFLPSLSLLEAKAACTIMGDNIASTVSLKMQVPTNDVGDLIANLAMTYHFD
jgi:hypothetical protein